MEREIVDGNKIYRQEGVPVYITVTKTYEVNEPLNGFYRKTWREYKETVFSHYEWRTISEREFSFDDEDLLI